MKKYCISLTIILLACSGSNENSESDSLIEEIDEPITTSSTTTTSTTSSTTTTLLNLYGDWEVYENVSQMDDSISYVANLKSTKEVKSKNFTSIPNLQLICSEGNYKLNINTGLILTPYYEGNLGEVLVTVRLDKNESQTLIVDEGTDQEVIFFREPAMFIAFQAMASNLLVEMTPFNSNKDYAEFELDGLYYVLSEFQEKCYNQSIQVGLLAKKNKLDQQELTTAAGEYFWSTVYNKTAFESRISPLRIAFLGDWDENLKQNMKNDLIATLQQVVEVDIKDIYEKYYTDIVVYNNKDSVFKDRQVDLSNPQLDELGYFATPMYQTNAGVDECLVWIANLQHRIEIYKCLGVSKYFDVLATGTVRDYTYNFSENTFVELEVPRLTDIDLALIGLVYNNSYDTLGGYSSMSDFIQTLNSYDNS